MKHKKIIKSLKLIKHPEGGYYRETFRSESIIPKSILHKTHKDDRSFATLIYYMLVNDDISCFHRLRSDEIWHFYEGSDVIIYEINEEGKLNKILLGNKKKSRAVYHHVIKAGSWFAAELADKSSYCLIGCTVVPGFHFDDFEIGDRNILLKQFPHHKKLIIKMTNK